MRAVLLIMALALTACGGTATDAELHEVVTCDSDWTDALPGADTSDGCEAPCESLNSLGADSSCLVTLDPQLGPFACNEDNGGFFADWRGRRGCCFLHGDDFRGVKFHECE